MKNLNCHPHLDRFIFTRFWLLSPSLQMFVTLSYYHFYYYYYLKLFYFIHDILFSLCCQCLVISPLIFCFSLNNHVIQGIFLHILEFWGHFWIIKQPPPNLFPLLIGKGWVIEWKTMGEKFLTLLNDYILIKIRFGFASFMDTNGSVNIIHTM